MVRSFVRRSLFSVVEQGVLVSLLCLSGLAAFANEENSDSKKGEACVDSLAAQSEVLESKPVKERKRKPRVAQAALPVATSESASALDLSRFGMGSVGLSYAQLGEEYSIDDLLTTDPAKNLAVKYPTIVMKAEQVIWAAIMKYGTRRVKSTLYPIRSYNDYPALTAGVPEADGRFIIGNQEPVEKFAEFVFQRASGRSGGDVLTIDGPAGTGKTEFLYIVDALLTNLAAKDPAFAQFTYKFVNLSEVPSLQPALNLAGDLIIQLMPQTPSILLPPEILDYVVDMAKSRVREVTHGLDPIPWTVPDNQFTEIMNHLVAYYRRINPEKYRVINPEIYVEILRKHVRIVRRFLDPNQPPAIIRYAGKVPDMTKYIASEHPSLSIDYPGQALGWNFNGKIPVRIGLTLGFDEFYRNSVSFRDSTLEIAQNNVAEVDGSPALSLNLLPLIATNTESIDDSKSQAGSRAHRDRSRFAAMRYMLNPYEVAKAVVHMSFPRKAHKKYRMRALNSDKWTPVNIHSLFPVADEKGNLTGPDGRYEWTHIISEGNEITIAPRALWLLALTASATRFVTDQKALTPYLAELNQMGPQSQYFTRVKDRMDIILRRTFPKEGGILHDLDTANRVLKEGTNGISQRDADKWWARCLEIARRPEFNNTVTPWVVNLAFREMLNDNGFVDTSNDLRPRWILIHNRMKADYLLPELTSDIQAIVSGETGRAEKIYSEVFHEVAAMNSDDRAEYWFSGSERYPINRGRLTEIAAIFRRVNGMDFSPNLLTTWKMGAQGEDFYEPLMRAITQFVMEKELTMGVYRELVDYLDGKGGVSEEVRQLGRAAEVNVRKLGYNLTAFRQAMRFVVDVDFEERRQRGE